jgi:hypothetical protein
MAGHHLLTSCTTRSLSLKTIEIQTEIGKLWNQDTS